MHGLTGIYKTNVNIRPYTAICMYICQYWCYFSVDTSLNVCIANISTKLYMYCKVENRNAYIFILCTTSCNINK